MNSISPDLNMMIKACEKASKVIIRDFGEVENLQVSKKGPKDFVTKTDKHVEEILVQELSKNKKNYSFITEETGIINNSDKDSFWIIDPIDGTTNFLHGIPHFAISIALKSENEIISGLVYDPINPYKVAWRRPLGENIVPERYIKYFVENIEKARTLIKLQS